MKWRYRLFGPTVTHLQFEFYLLVALMMLSYGSLLGLYKESFGTKGDYVFLLLVLVAAGRHLLFRLLCTWDPSTHASPGIAGILSHLLQTHVAAGQTFDRPPANYFPASGSHVVAGSTLTPVPAAADRMAQITGGFMDVKGATSWVHLLPTTLVYAWQLPRVYIWFPILRLFGSSRATNTKNSRRNPEIPNVSWFQQTSRSAQQILLQFWAAYGPTMQFLLASGVFVYFTGRFYRMRTGSSPLSLIFGPSQDVNNKVILSVNTQNSNAMRQAVGKHGDRAAGTYKPMLKPPEDEVFFMMLAVGTLSSLIVFSRIMLPLPDLVAGSNVVKDVRTEARAASSTMTGSSSAGKKSSRTGSGGVFSSQSDNIFWFSSTPPTVLASENAGWTERQRSIVTENRLHLAIHVIIVRVVENAFLVGILPRTIYTCRATGHCPSGPSMWELSRVLFPAGFSEAGRTDGGSSFGFMESDAKSGIWTLFGVLIVSVVLLIAQTVVLNRSYLSILGYIAGEWELVEVPKDSKIDGNEKKQPKSPASSQLQSSVASFPEATVWDPRRKYKKGELVVYPNAGSSTYRATCNYPEGRPCDSELVGVNEMFQTELGHASTSSLLCKIAAVQLIVVWAHNALWVLLLLFGYSTYGLIWAVAAHIVAAHGVLSVTTTAINKGVVAKAFGFQSMGELERLNAEIMAGN